MGDVGGVELKEEARVKKLCGVIGHLQIAKSQMNSSHCRNFDELRM